jgi:competence protein ComEC
LNPGGFDYERWLFEEGVGATGYILSYPRPMLLDSKPAWTSIIQLRQTIAVD